tara:strand:- start:565 stop:873 length:309 start_codon:yes stop_codon:yes gene_type:complete
MGLSPRQELAQYVRFVDSQIAPDIYTLHVDIAVTLTNDGTSSENSIAAVVNFEDGSREKIIFGKTTPTTREAMEVAKLFQDTLQDLGCKDVYYEFQHSDEIH